MAQDEESACEMFDLYMHLMGATKVRINMVLAEYGLSNPQGLALHVLDPLQPAPMRGLAEAMNCDASNVTGIVDRLEALGLVERQVDVDDRRVKVLALTDKGTKLRTEILKRIAVDIPQVRNLDEREQAQLRKLLKKALG